MRSIPFAAAVCLALPLVLSGCYVETGEEPTAQSSAEPAPPAETEAATMDGSTSTTTTGGRSTLGKAKSSAKNTVGALEQHDADIQKEIDDQNR